MGIRTKGKAAASTNRVGQFEMEILTQGRSLQYLTNLSGRFCSKHGMSELAGKLRYHFQGDIAIPARVKLSGVSEGVRFGIRASAVTVVVAVAAFSAKAGVINIYPRDDYQPKIESAVPGDEVIFNPGVYSIGQDAFIDIKRGVEASHITYTFDNAIISGTGSEHDSLIVIQRGGFVDIIGIESTLQNSKQGFVCRNEVFKDVTISGFNFSGIYQNSVRIENVKHASPLTKAAVNISDCTADGLDKFVRFDEKSMIVDANSPFTGVVNCTLRNITSPEGIVDIPVFYKEDGQGGGEWIALGDYEISGNFLENCSSLSFSDYFWLYHSLRGIAQKDLAGAYLLSGETYYDFWGNPHVFEGENCFVADANDFLLDGITPRRDRRLNLGGGTYIGAVEPYHEVPGNLNFDEKVDFLDFAVAASRHDGGYDAAGVTASHTYTNNGFYPISYTTKLTVIDDRGLSGDTEIEINVNPADTDIDGLADSWEMYYFNDLSQESSSDPDNDGFVNIDEYVNKTDPTVYTDLPADLILDMKLDDDSVDGVLDSSIYGNNGVIYGDPVLTSDRDGFTNSAYDFDGNGDFIEIPHSNSLDVDRITVAAWIYRHDTGDDRVVCKSTGTAINDHIFSLGVADAGAGQSKVRVRLAANGTYDSVDGTRTFPREDWAHIAFTYDGAYIRIYVDGQEGGSFSKTGDITKSSIPVVIGNVNLTEGRYLNGKLDEVKIYSRALTADEIMSLFSGG